MRSRLRLAPTCSGPLLFAHLIKLVTIDDRFADRTLERFFAAYSPDVG